MKRLLSMVSTFLILTGMYGGSVGADSVFTVSCKSYGSGCYKVLGGKFAGEHVPDSHKRRYLESTGILVSEGWSISLAVAPGSWTAGISLRGIKDAKNNALKNCKRHTGSDSCKIVDANGRSAFIKERRSSSSSLVSTSRVNIDDPVELEFWQTVKDGDDLEMYQAYLQSYPNGQFGSLAISRIEELTPKPKSEADKKKDSEIELEFWRSVKDSGDPDLLQAYLDEYPNGHFALIAKIKIKKLKAGISD